MVALALIAGPVASQQHQHDEGAAATDAQQMEMHCSMMRGMMGMMGGGGGMEMTTGMMTGMTLRPQYVLQHKDALQLTPAQVSRIETLGSSAMGMRGMADMPMGNMPMMQAQRERVQAAFEKSPADPAAIQAAMRDMATMLGGMMAEQLVTAAKVRDVLTPAQREQVAKLPSPCMKEGAPAQHAPPPAS
ncbi:MAG: Spy/CpxP family protein refolding chaperone [Gemmatimonadales bacterium]|nr:Spy/CpxP family protein refolding chaperone [Gemmatimonadales bacterium]